MWEVKKRKSLGWLIGASVALVGAAVFLLTKTHGPSRRRFLVTQSFSGQVYLIHKGGYDGPDTAGNRVQTMNVPDSGIVVTEQRMPTGYDDTYFDVVPTGGLAQLRVQDLGVIEDTPANRSDPRRLVFNPNAGVLDLPNCRVFTESFYVGTPAFLLGNRSSFALEHYVEANPEVCVRK